MKNNNNEHKCPYIMLSALARFNSKIVKYKQMRDSTVDFMARYGDLIDGPDGIFGVVCDDVLFYMMTFWPPKTIYSPLNRRFLTLRDPVLGHLAAGRVPEDICERLRKRLFPTDALLYYHIINGSVELSNGNSRGAITRVVPNGVHRCVIQDNDIDVITINERRIKYKIVYYKSNTKILYTTDSIFLIDNCGNVTPLNSKGSPLKIPGLFGAKSSTITNHRKLAKPKFCYCARD